MSAFPVRQLACLEGLARGLSYTQLAVELGVTRWAVKTHLKRAYGLLGARNQHHAVSLAYQRGLLPLTTGFDLRFRPDPSLCQNQRHPRTPDNSVPRADGHGYRCNDCAREARRRVTR